MVKVYKIHSGRRSNFLSNLSINTILILLNVLLFIVFSILIATNIISIDTIAIKPSNILQGKYIWTFVTSMFMHGGFFHLFVNMFSLFFVGGLAQRILGSKRYLGFYLISGLFAGLVFVLWSFITQGADFNAFAVGASGALFGVIGLLMLLTPNLRVYLMFIPIPIKMKYAAPGILVVLWLVSSFGNINVGNTAHLGGLLTGVTYALYLKYKYKRKTDMISNHYR